MDTLRKQIILTDALTIEPPENWSSSFSLRFNVLGSTVLPSAKASLFRLKAAPCRSPEVEGKKKISFAKKFQKDAYIPEYFLEFWKTPLFAMYPLLLYWIVSICQSFVFIYKFVQFISWLVVLIYGLLFHYFPFIYLHISAPMLYYWLTNPFVHPRVCCFLSFLCMCLFIKLCFVFSHVSLIYCLLISFCSFTNSLFIDYSSFVCRIYSLFLAIYCLSIDLLFIFHSSIFSFLHSFCIV